MTMSASDILDPTCSAYITSTMHHVTTHRYQACITEQHTEAPTHKQEHVKRVDTSLCRSLADTMTTHEVVVVEGGRRGKRRRRRTTHASIATCCCTHQYTLMQASQHHHDARKQLTLCSNMLHAHCEQVMLLHHLRSRQEEPPSRAEEAQRRGKRVGA